MSHPDSTYEKQNSYPSDEFSGKKSMKAKMARKIPKASETVKGWAKKLRSEIDEMPDKSKIRGFK